MAFEGLSSRLQDITRKLRGKARITESDLKEMLREVKLALLEADVNYKIVKEFNASVQEKALGQDVLKSLTPGQQVIKIVKDELVELLGGTPTQIGDAIAICIKNIEGLVCDPVAGLDVSLLQDYVLTPILGIEDPRTDKRIDFVGGIRGLGELERRCHTDMVLAFSMYPTSINELFEVADAGLLMPPKSTWFEPKLRSGIFIHQI